ncbi:MAG: ATP-dependent helicase [Desulfotalea sp.]|nr:MAG: ATP-dependent helicase [Desulfotalea sp.]
MLQLNDIFQENGILSKVLQGFEPRDGQREMAVAIEEALFTEADANGSLRRSLVVEAETGIGKTLAYLIPAVLSGKKIVISTATLNLQDQIIGKDIPLVKEILGTDVPVVCVKGRENYLCLYRWYQYRSNADLSGAKDPNVHRIDKWLKSTKVGDKAELEWLGENRDLWSKISAQSSQCLGSNCPEGSLCFVTQLRKRAGAARILIVNHHLFFSDLALKKEGYGDILPRYEAVIFDEAHHVEDIASVFFSSSFSQYQLIDLLNDIEQQAKNDLSGEKTATLLPMLSGLRKRGENFAALFPQELGRFYLTAFIEKISQVVWLEEVDLLNTGLANLEKEMALLAPYGESWLAFASRSDSLGEKLRDIAIAPDDEDAEMIRWYEKQQRSVALSATPLEVATILDEQLYRSVECCIMTSATLATGGSFSYIKKRLGLGEDTKYLQFSSPFDYEKHAQVYIPERSFPEPTDKRYPEALNRRVCALLKVTSGRALVLCTSFKAMERLADALEKELDYKILVQGRGSKTALLDTFRKETHSVLIAVASFWEGVDVSGESLSCVVIDKLPFEVPTDPVLQTRIERVRSDGGNPFFEYQVPRAVLSLKQGVGRLIRSTTDTGVVAIMDVRLYTKGYGRTFLKSLPGAPIIREIEDVKEFFRLVVDPSTH